MNNLVVTIMAGGVGKRMKSDLPKVLHKFKGIPMLVRIIKECLKLNIKKIIIITGKFHSLITNTLKEYINHNDFIKINFIIQKNPLGTGHAIKCTLDEYEDNDKVVILNGDMPLINSDVINNLYNYSQNNSILVAELNNSHGYGRIIYDNNRKFIKIKEEKDCNDIERNIKIINSGLYKINGSDLKYYILKINNNNKQNEYYLTDIIELMVNDNKIISTYKIDSNQNKLIMGINSKEELSNLEKI